MSSKIIKKYKVRKIKYCNNCGKKGHLNKKCLYPVISNGIICIKMNNKIIKINKILKSLMTNNNSKYLELDYEPYLNDSFIDIKFLLIRRKNTYSYVEFIRGKYDFNNINYIIKLLKHMTKEELENIKNKTFDEIWRSFWLSESYSKKHINEYHISKKKYNKLNKNYTEKIKNIVTIWEHPEWGFPKGRRLNKENNFNCANREFKEETGLRSIDYEIIKIKPLHEVYIGINNVKYQHQYYIAQSLTDIKMVINPENSDQYQEISDIGWFSYKETLNMIRPYNIEKKNIVKNINNILKYFLSNGYHNHIFTHKNNNNKINSTNKIS